MQSHNTDPKSRGVVKALDAVAPYLASPMPGLRPRERVASAEDAFAVLSDHDHEHVRSFGIRIVDDQIAAPPLHGVRRVHKAHDVSHTRLSLNG